MKCSREDCNKEAKNRGFCYSHYMRWWRHGEGEPAPLKQAPNGTGCIDNNGYVKVKVNGKSTYEHIVLAEKALGRKLTEDEVVHHTGKRHENHGPFKLVICTREYHALIHKRMKELGYENN